MDFGRKLHCKAITNGLQSGGGLTLDMDMESLFAGLISADGSMDFERERPAIDPGLERWLPAYFTAETQDKVIDPTGAGNGFLGGLSSTISRPSV